MSLPLLHAGPAVDIVPWNPTQLLGLALWLPTANPRYLFREGVADTVPDRTLVTSDGDLVGTIYSPDRYANRVITSAARRAAMGSGGGRSSYLIFNGNPFYVVENSTRSFSEVYTTGVFSIKGVIQSTLDGTAGTILDSTNGTGASVGFLLYKNASDMLIFGPSNGSSFFTAVVGTAGTSQLKAADGPLPFRIDGNGTTLTMQIGTKMPDTAAWVASGLSAGAAATYNLTLGIFAAGVTNPLNALLGDLVITCGVAPTTADWTAFKAFNPPRASASLLSSSASFLHSHLDTSDTTKQWTDLARTIQVASLDDQCYVIDNKVGQGASRNAISDGATHRAKYKPNIQGGLGSLQLDGVDDNYVFQKLPNGGRSTLIFVATSLDVGVVNAGSHAMSSSGGYLAFTSPNYNGNPADGAYWLAHGDVSAFGSSSVGGSKLVNPSGPNIITIVRDRDSLVGMCNGRSMLSATDTTAVIGYNQIGAALIPGWEFDGRFHECQFYTEALSDSQLAAKIAAARDKWGVSNVF